MYAKYLFVIPTDSTVLPLCGDSCESRFSCPESKPIRDTLKKSLKKIVKIRGRLRYLLGCLSIIAFLTLSACQRDRQSESMPDEASPEKLGQGIRMDFLKGDLGSFLDHFKKISFKADQLNWSYAPKSFSVSKISPDLQTALMYADRNDMPHDMLIQNFHMIFYYLDKVRWDYKFNKTPIPVDVVKIINDFLNAKFRIDTRDKTRKILTLRSYSSLLRLINEIDDPALFSDELIARFSPLPFVKIKEILTRSIYDLVRTEFYKSYSFDEDLYNPAYQCQKYWAISPILKIDPLYATDLNRLNILAMEVHGLFADTEKNMYGELKDHLLCVETIEEAIGRSPDPISGVGITNKYLAYIVKTLWDYPFHGKACAPFRGVMATIPRGSGEQVDFCENNYKTVLDNLYLLYLINKFNVTGEVDIAIEDIPQRSINQRIMLDYERKLEKTITNSLPGKNGAS